MRDANSASPQQSPRHDQEKGLGIRSELVYEFLPKVLDPFLDSMAYALKVRNNRYMRYADIWEYLATRRRTGKPVIKNKIIQVQVSQTFMER